MFIHTQNTEFEGEKADGSLVDGPEKSCKDVELFSLEGGSIHPQK